MDVGDASKRRHTIETVSAHLSRPGFALKQMGPGPLRPKEMTNRCAEGEQRLVGRLSLGLPFLWSEASLKGGLVFYSCFYFIF